MPQRIFFLFSLLLLGFGLLSYTPASLAPSSPNTPLMVQSLNPTPEPQHIHLLEHGHAYILCGGSLLAKAADEANPSYPTASLRATSYGPDVWLLECLPPE
ncbi:MAG: hypothetical protein KJ063_02480 [Anaerolineae bacterium]|nr:hypothetical protein [Anaerolineae bacterium]